MYTMMIYQSLLVHTNIKSPIFSATPLLTMSYEQFDTDGRPAPKDCCARFLGRYDPREDPLEFLSLVSLVSLAIGIILVMVGYIYPRDYTKDPNKEAVKMEQIEIYYAELAWDLDVCILVGMSFVVLGGLILAGIICYLHVTVNFWGQVCGDDLGEEVDPRIGGGGQRQAQRKGVNTSQGNTQQHQGYGSTKPNTSAASTSSLPPSGASGGIVTQLQPQTKGSLSPTAPPQEPVVSPEEAPAPRPAVHASAPSPQLVEGSN